MSGVELYGLFIGQSAFTASYWERLSPATKTAWEVLARKMDYGNGRDYGAECDAIIEVRNAWLNKRITSAECREWCAAVREHWPRWQT